MHFLVSGKVNQKKQLGSQLLRGEIPIKPTFHRWYCWWKKSYTSWYGSLFHNLQSFIHPKWCRISSINSIYHWNHQNKTIIKTTGLFTPNRSAASYLLHSRKTQQIHHLPRRLKKTQQTKASSESKPSDLGATPLHLNFVTQDPIGVPKACKSWNLQLPPFFVQRLKLEKTFGWLSRPKKKKVPTLKIPSNKNMDRLSFFGVVWVWL